MSTHTLYPLSSPMKSPLANSYYHHRTISFFDNDNIPSIPIHPRLSSLHPVSPRSTISFLQAQHVAIMYQSNSAPSPPPSKSSPTASLGDTLSPQFPITPPSNASSQRHPVCAPNRKSRSCFQKHRLSDLERFGRVWRLVRHMDGWTDGTGLVTTPAVARSRSRSRSCSCFRSV